VSGWKEPDFSTGSWLTTDTEIYRNYDREFDKILKEKPLNEKLTWIDSQEIPEGRGLI
jgi:hypothetical protein